MLIFEIANRSGNRDHCTCRTNPQVLNKPRIERVQICTTRSKFAMQREEGEGDPAAAAQETRLSEVQTQITASRTCSMRNGMQHKDWLVSIREVSR